MNAKRNVTMSVVWIVLGAVLFICGVLEILDGFWSGMGGGILGVGIVQMARHVRYKKDESYREKVDVQNRDERNRFLANKAWAWAGYLYVMINAISIILLKIAGYDELSTWAAYSVCLIMVLYWLCYLWLNKKY